MRAHVARIIVCAVRGHAPLAPPNAVKGSGPAEPSRVVQITYETGERYGLCCCSRCGLGFWDVRPRPEVTK